MAIKGKSASKKDFKHILALSFLLGIVYLSPGFGDAIVGQANVAAATTSSKSQFICPQGYVCTPLETVNSGRPSLSVLFPNGGENFNHQESIVISWKSTNPSIRNVDISLLEKGGEFLTQIASNTPNVGYFTWTPPPGFVQPGTSMGLKVLVSSAGNGPKAEDVSDLAFSLSGPAMNNCFTFVSNLQLGSTGDEVIALQSLLISSGFAIPSLGQGDYKGIMGTFDEDTMNAVKLYQESKGIPATGFVGPLTRASLNACSYVYIPAADPIVEF